MVRILGTTGSRRRRRYQLAALLSVVALLALIAVPASAVLPGSPSTFESGNDPTLGLGNMIVDNLPVPPPTPHTDWISVTGNSAYFHATDAAAVNTDDSFTPGQKQDTTCPTVEGHKNPPKDDFTDVASFFEVASNGDVYLYGATIRYTANGNASENIELKQSSTPCTVGGTLSQRTPGDKMIAIDYLGGGSAVQFHVLTWVDTGACFVSKDPLPCWGANVLSLDPNVAEGGVNSTDLTAAQNPISGVPLVAGQFAEFGVNLAGAGIIPVGSCMGFSQTVWESRSSGSSFVSSTKDITIEDKSINQCASVSVTKVGSDGGSQAGAVFTLYHSTGSNPVVLGAVVGTCTVTATGACLNTANPPTNPFVGLNPGQYTLSETNTPSGYSTDPSLPYTFTLTASQNLTLTFTDPALKGAIKITKTSSKGLHPGLDGATFSITKDGTAITGSPFTTANGGVICVPALAFGDYVVTETAPPTGYAIDDTTGHTVSVVATGTCSTGTQATFAATDTPLTTLVVTATGEASPAGTTKSQITCTGPSPGTGNIGNSPTANTDPVTMTAQHLKPGTYACTVVIDP
jgi:hypothetical protein